jgi:hypothetical protein
MSNECQLLYECQRLYRKHWTCLMNVNRFTAVWQIQDVYPGSRILIFTHPGSRISDPGSKNSNKRERWKKISCHTFLCSHKFHKIVNYFSFEVLNKKMWASFQRIITIYQKNCQKALKNMVLGSADPGSEIRDLGSGKNLFRIPDPGVKKAQDPGSGSATLLYRKHWTCLINFNRCTGNTGPD